jgi:cell division protein FtsB
MTATNGPHNLTRSPNQWSITYTQNDLDAIREQIEQNESEKRRRLVFAALVLVVALAGAIVLLSTNYALYSSSQSQKNALLQENATLKSRADQLQKQLDEKVALETKDAQGRSDAQARLDKLMPAILRGSASPAEIGSFARMVHGLPSGRVELSSKPPDKLFRNWKTTNGAATEVYALVGGFADGKWVVYSNLIVKKQSTD